MLPWSKKKTDSRTYINLIHTKASKFANWEPSFPIELGDYGTVDRDTGEFKKDGNVVEIEDANDKLSIRDGVEDEKYTIFSFGVSEVNASSESAINFSGIAEAFLKAHFKFKRRYGAVLLMWKPVTSKLEGINKLFQLQDYEFLRSKYLVTEVVRCSAYAMYLSAKSSETIGIVFGAKAPGAQLADASIGGETGASWDHKGGSGVFRCGSQPSRSFTTLYHTQVIHKIEKYNLTRELEMPDPETVGKDRWMDTGLPWNTLDEDGEEMDPLVASSDDFKDF